jgi:hypothetical protein
VNLVSDATSVLNRWQSDFDQTSTVLSFDYGPPHLGWATVPAYWLLNR